MCSNSLSYQEPLLDSFRWLSDGARPHPNGFSVVPSTTTRQLGALVGFRSSNIREYSINYSSSYCDTIFNQSCGLLCFDSFTPINLFAFLICDWEWLLQCSCPQRRSSKRGFTVMIPVLSACRQCIEIKYYR